MGSLYGYLETNTNTQSQFRELMTYILSLQCGQTWRGDAQDNYPGAGFTLRSLAVGAEEMAGNWRG